MVKSPECRIAGAAGASGATRESHSHQYRPFSTFSHHQVRPHSQFRSHSHHNWGARLGRSRDDYRTRSEPSTLLQMEELARRAVTLMEVHCPKSEHNFPKAMDLLREQYNLNFMMRCEKCHGHHMYDELSAPER